MDRIETAKLQLEAQFFRKAWLSMVRINRLTPQSRLSVADGEAFVWEGDALYTIERVSKFAAALISPEGREIGRWAV